MENLRELYNIGTNEYGNTYEIISIVSFLIGIDVNIFEDADKPPKKETYDELSQNQSAQIMRDLCIVRGRIERYYGTINKLMINELKTFYSMPDFIPKESIDRLQQNGITIIKPNQKLWQYIIDLNKLISDKINNCKTLFPLWLNWEYIKGLFIMKGGLTEEGVKAAGEVYNANRSYYPYGVYINWEPKPDVGNIFYTDGKFLRLIYTWNDDEFTDTSKVSDARYSVKNTIYDFIDMSNSTVFIVDCENSDPYKLIATLRNLELDYFDKINKIILIDDNNTVNIWQQMASFIRIPVEYHLIERIKDEKSLVDVALVTHIMQEFYKNDVDSFILFASDSDYWALINATSDIKYLVMLENEKASYALKQSLLSAGIRFFYIDDFYSGNSYDIQLNVMLTEAQKYLDTIVNINVNDMLQYIYTSTRINMSPSEKEQFCSKYIRPMTLSIDENGNVSIQLRRNR